MQQEKGRGRKKKKEKKTHLQSQVDGMELTALSCLPTLMRATLEYDLTEEEPPVHDQLVDQTATSLETEETVVHWEPESASEAPQLLW